MDFLDKSPAGMEISRLEGVAADLIANSLAPSTQRTYKVGQSEYLDFCNRLSVPPAPASEAVLILFVAHCHFGCHSAQ